ncbi:MAG: hypothetical protein IJ658_03865, partial [Kiritimatiellae bacterium]|nr:hypothetical protein [Kiritimatiellia bacterium]
PFVFGAILLALGGVWCTVWLARALREEREERDAIHAVEMESAEPVAATDGFPAKLGLSSGWTASFEFPECQRAQVDRNAKTRETVFRMTSGTNGVVRFAKTLPLFARPPKVYYTVTMLSAARPGTTVPFKFTARVIFRDAAGRTVGEDIQTKPRSITNHAVKVPAGAEAAELRIDCLCSGTYDLLVPIFKTEPIGKSRKSR